MSLNYFQNSDVPDMNDPETAIAIAMQSADSITPAALTAHADNAGQTLSAIQQWATEQGIQNLPEMTLEVWQQIQAMQEKAAALHAAREVALNALHTLDEARRALAAEHNELLDAIADHKENHPVLDEFVDHVRREAQEETSAMMNQADIEVYQINLTDFLRDQCGFAYPAAKMFAEQMYEWGTGIYTPLTEYQASLLKELCEQFDIPEWLKAKTS